MAKKVDRRVRKTKMQLRQGLARLMQKKSIKEITVKELVDEVDINRSTFYLHYTDIYQMLEKIEEEAMADIREAMEGCPDDCTEREKIIPFLARFFSIMDSNRDLLKDATNASKQVSHPSCLTDLIIRSKRTLQKQKNW